MPRGRALARFYRPGGGGFELFFARRVGNSPIKKLPRGFARGGGWSGLELTDTLSTPSVENFFRTWDNLQNVLKLWIFVMKRT